MPTRGQRDSRKQEKSVAADYDGEVQPGSGNTWRRPNDVRSEHYSIECKTTRNKSARLERSALDQAEIYALADGRDMIWVNDIGEPGNQKRYITMRDYTWQAHRRD